ncbi:hypothetical protein D8B26_001352 [Coccidioides posadasii str. Silveira]|uniref:uncharacterized protein n=1 Tax=Coccidioides posadasii (strain RMSCC 757 / Silveira) TaxID=443226 RepID=UPI001BED4ADB|nr:hypothetical protein D8B26_001352 [Coccidioides posadasii str. Silveira]
MSTSPKKQNDRRVEANVRKSRQEFLSLGDKAKQPRRITKPPQEPVRRSVRLRHSCHEWSRNTQHEYRYPSSTKNTAGKEFQSKPPSPPQVNDRKRKRPQDTEEPLHFRAKLRRRSQTFLAAEDTPIQEPASDAAKNEIDPIRNWIQKGYWPKKYFNQDISMSSLLPRKKSTSSLRRKGPSDEKQKEEKNAPYVNPRYQTILETKGSFMKKARVGIRDESSLLIKALLNTDQMVPQNSLFRDDLFDTTCEKIQCENEPRIIRDIGQLIVPSAETLATYGATNLEHLVETVNKGWNKSIPFYGPRPQPDYSVGFRRSAFTDDQLEKLKPFIGDWDDTSFFMATDTMHFPFLTCEVKCGEVALDIADRQNAHSMTLSVRGVVELFRAVKRENEVHREILAFSISHDHTAVRIYGHYALVDDDKITFYRHPIHNFSFAALDGKEKWTAYRFTKNVYDIWMPTHLKRICSAIDQIPPGFDFGVLQSGLPFPSTSKSF